MVQPRTGLAARLKIPLTKPYFGEEELEALREPLTTGWVTQGPKVEAFEEEFARWLGVAHAISCSSCTAALHLSLIALGIGPGDEVIVPAFTFVASANAIEYVGAKPVFVDIDLETFNMNIDQVEQAITPQTRVIMPVHLFGLSVEMMSLLAFARQHHLFVVEDAACAIGSRYQGRLAGTFGDVGCFSLHPRKVITTGEGGMVVTHQAEIAETIASLRSHGASESDFERHEAKGCHLPDYDRLGFNYRMTDLQAAIGLIQLKRVDQLIAERRRLAQRYHKALSHLRGIRLPIEPEGYFHMYQSYVILMTEEAMLSRDELAERLAEEGIATRQGTHAVPLLGYYASKYGFRPHDFPHAVAAAEKSLTLPLYPQMSEEEQGYVIDRVQKIMKGNKP